MNISISFNNLINTCLLDISNSLNDCSEQIRITHENIENIENQLKNNIPSNKLQKLVTENKHLLLDNFCLISQQSQLITHYHHLISIMSRKIFMHNKEKELEVLNDLLGYYEKYQKKENVELIKNYLGNVS